MNATLYLPQNPPQAVSVEGLSIPNSDATFALVPEQVPVLLGCAPNMVDVLACAQQYVAYSIFDYEGGLPNETAMDVLATLTGNTFDVNDEDTILLGPILMITA